MTFKELAKEVEKLKSMQKSPDLLPAQNDVVSKQVRDLENFSQQRAHLIHDIQPENTTGLNGEVRVLTTGGGDFIMIKVNGVWKKVAVV